MQVGRPGISFPLATAMASVAVASAVACEAAAASAEAGRRGSFLEKEGTEYTKHNAFRHDNGLIFPDGRWKFSGPLLALQEHLPPMSARARDVLHIIWMLFEAQGKQPAQVDQVWAICQSITRDKPPYHKGQFRKKPPQIPGLHLKPAGRHAGRTLAPCVLPRSRLWANLHQRFLLGAEALQLQGAHLPSYCPAWRRHPDALLHRVAGDMYTLPVVGWYVLLAIAALLPRGSRATAGPRGAMASGGPGGCHGAGATFVDSPLQPRAMAHQALQVLMSRWPGVFAHWDAPVQISIGSLCSGADYVKGLAASMAEVVGELDGAPSIGMINMMACEIDRQVWALAQGAPRHFYPDVHKLPVDLAPDVDMCLVSAMCTSLSRCNSKRRRLADACRADPLQASGATTASALKYITAKRPPICIMENVTAVADRVVEEDGTISRDVDMVLECFRDLGYTCGYDKVDAASWGMPQTRARVYIWALLPHLPGAQVFGDGIRRAHGGIDQVPFTRVLCSGL